MLRRHVEVILVVFFAQQINIIVVGTTREVNWLFIISIQIIINSTAICVNRSHVSNLIGRSCLQFSRTSHLPMNALGFLNVPGDVGVSRRHPLVCKEVELAATSLHHVRMQQTSRHVSLQ